MKTIISLVVLGFSLIALTGCYTRVVTLDNNDEGYEKTETIIVVIPPPPPPDPCPCPGPILVPAPPPHNPSQPVFNPNPPKEKVRKPNNNKSTRPNNDGSIRDDLRRSGSRDNTDKRNR